jgi:hypothetical protein
LRRYSGKGYRDYNGILRHGEGYLRRYGRAGQCADPLGNSLDIGGVLNDIRLIDRAIAGCESPPMNLYRRCEVEIEFERIRFANPGDSFVLRGYTSTTVSEKAAMEFKGDESRREVVEILFPGGTGGGVFMRENAEWEKEFEFLLKRGSRCKLVSKPDGINKRYVFEMMP